MNQLRLLSLAAIVAVALFFAGRWTAPSAEDKETRRKFDSVTRSQRQTDHLREQAEKREEIFKQRAEELERQAAERAEADRIASTKTYAKDTAANHRATPSKRDSMLWARYPSPMPRRRATP
jgi:FtsZ-interacting cell division protein ZipA